MDCTELYDCVVVGGGIAGMSALEEICSELPQARILLITGSAYVKVASVKLQLARRVEELDVHEQSTEHISRTFPNVSVVVSALKDISPDKKLVTTVDHQQFWYKTLCLCTGALPKLLTPGNPYVLGIRDTDSAVYFQQKLSNSNRVVIVGNGGIATELVYQLTGVEIIWVVRDKYISAAFVDAGAGQFFLDSISKERAHTKSHEAAASSRTSKYTISRLPGQQQTVGCALGPNWHNNLDLHGAFKAANKSVITEYETEVRSIIDKNDISDADLQSLKNWPVYVKLTNGKTYGCDFIVSATGVVPCVPALQGIHKFRTGQDGGILVNETMETSIQDIYAAGDVCTVNWNTSPNWFQMRIWTQARIMGSFCGRCILSFLKDEPKPLLDFSFELFTHVTRFFGFKVVLLGLFNGQTLNGQYEAMVRVTPEVEYVKLVVKDGKVRGAVLVGETDLEETIENLILNEVDVSIYGEDLLNPDIDIEDYFD